jgi:hypothetical protein
LELNFAQIVLGWSPFKIVSGNPDLQPKWPPLLKIEKGGMKFKKNFLWNYWANWIQALLK